MLLIKTIIQFKLILIFLCIIIHIPAFRIQKALYKKELIKNNHFNFNQNHLNFILGFALGYGLTTDATEELKNCFLEKEKSSGEIIEKFLDSTKNQKKDLVNEEKKNVAFTTTAMNFIAKFKDCPPLKDTIMTFIKNHLISIGIKGIAFALAGPIGLLIKSAYHIIKLGFEIHDYYKNLNSAKLDYTKLGSNVGKIIYYAQNMLMRKKL